MNIVCLPDLLRGVRTFPDAFFDLMRESIRQGAGIDMGYPPGGKRPHGLMSGFDLIEFRALAGITARSFEDAHERQRHWSCCYHQLPRRAIDYLFVHIPAGCLLLSFEMPPWLMQACAEQGADFLDLRASPLRFGRDLYIALRSSRRDIRQRIGGHIVLDEELRLEAAILGANVRLHKARLESERGFTFEALDGCLLFAGQAPYDASLLAPDGRSLRADDFADRLLQVSRGRRLLHKGHPFALEAAQAERALLHHITGQTPELCQQNAYQILSSEEDVALVGISSGLLQEAVWFGKTAHMLYRPYVPLADNDNDNDNGNAYQQIHFQSLLAPSFWHQLLAPERSAPRLAALPELAHHHARQTIDQWWDYSKVLTWERTLPYETVMRGGGAGLRQRLEALERQAGQGWASAPSDDHDFSLNSGERQVATRYEDIRADHRYRYEWAHARLPEKGHGVDVFCGNGYGTHLLSTSRHVLGIDGSTDAIRLAEQHYRTPNTLFAQARYPFSLPSQAFDFAVSLESVEHVEQGEAFFAMLAASLKPGGLLFFSTPCETHLPHAKFSHLFHFHYRHYLLEEAKALIDAHGLELLEWAGQDVYSFNAQGQPVPLADPTRMQLHNGAERQFIIFACRKRIP